MPPRLPKTCVLIIRTGLLDDMVVEYEGISSWPSFADIRAAMKIVAWAYQQNTMPEVRNRYWRTRVNNVPPERVKKLREWVEKKSEGIAPNNTFYDPKMWTICKDLLAILDDYPALKAGNELATKMLGLADGIIEEQGAELAKQAPLIEAVMRADIEELRCDSTCAEVGDPMTLSDDSKDILCAALKLREEKGK